MKRFYIFDQAYLYTQMIIFICAIIICSCQPQDHTSKNNNSSSTSSIKKDSVLENREKKEQDLRIFGNIEMGCSESQLNKGMSDFKRKNSTLNGLKVNKYKGYFEKGRLIRLIIFSEPYHYISKPWTSLYIEKYKTKEGGALLFGLFGTEVNKGKIRINVGDCYTINTFPKSCYIDNETVLLYTKKSLLFSSKGLPRKSPFGYDYYENDGHFTLYSMIDISDTVVVDSLVNEINKKEENMEKELKKKNVESI